DVGPNRRRLFGRRARARRQAHVAQTLRDHGTIGGVERRRVTRKPVVYHIISEGRRQVSAASTLVVRAGRIAVELDPEMVKAKGVFVEIDPAKLRKLDEEGFVFGY